MELTPVEARVVGAMIEKSFLTPDVYPMTTNALVTACNQKTNRDPVVSYDAVTIDAALLEMRQRSIVRRVHTQGSRSTKHRHTLDEALELGDEELALVSVLLLRGAQTVGELRLRTERHIGFDSTDDVEQVLTGLSQRTEPLVRELARQPGQKENRWVHLLSESDPGVTQPAPMTAAATDPLVAHVEPPAASAPPRLTPAETPLDTPRADEDLRRRVDGLEREVATLRQQLRALADQLGESFE